VCDVDEGSQIPAISSRGVAEEEEWVRLTKNSPKGNVEPRREVIPVVVRIESDGIGIEFLLGVSILLGGGLNYHE
jgi:hypothetical protein